MLKEICYMRREDKKENIFRKCCMKMKNKKLRLFRKEKRKDRKISKLNRNTHVCLRNKNKIDLTSSRIEKRELKNLWIKWLIPLLRIWTISKKKKMIRYADMKWKKKWEKEWKTKRNSWKLNQNNREWEIS